MRSRRALAAALALGVLGSPGAAAAYEELPRALARATPDMFAQGVRVLDEPHEPYVQVSTRKAWSRGRRLQGAHAEDVHLRAMVDRQSGAVRWQVWHELVVHDRPSEIIGVNYRVGGRTEQGRLVRIDQWDDCPGVDAIQRACNRHARVVFELPGSVVEEIAAAYRANSREPWRLRFSERGGGTVTGGLAPAEVAGLRDAVEHVRRGLQAG